MGGAAPAGEGASAGATSSSGGGAASAHPVGPIGRTYGGALPDLFAAQLSCLDSSHHIADEVAGLIAFLKAWQEDWEEATRTRQCLYLSSLELQLALGLLGMLSVGVLGMVWVLACRRRRPTHVPVLVQGPVAPLRPEGMRRSDESHPIRLRRIRAGAAVPGGPTEV